VSGGIGIVRVKRATEGAQFVTSVLRL
jgi:hypothetical protein